MCACRESCATWFWWCRANTSWHTEWCWPPRAISSTSCSHVRNTSNTAFQSHTDTSTTNPAAFACAASMMEATNHEVELGGAEPEIIELLVEFVYTARLDMTSLHRCRTRILHAFWAHACFDSVSESQWTVIMCSLCWTPLTSTRLNRSRKCVWISWRSRWTPPTVWVRHQQLQVFYGYFHFSFLSCVSNHYKAILYYIRYNHHAIWHASHNQRYLTHA